MTILTFAVNENNDIYLDEVGNIAFAYDLEAIKQQCQQAAQTLLGEMIYNVNDGIPYFQTIWVGVPNVAQFTAALRRAFLAVGGVLEIITLITSQSNDTLSYTATIRTIYGNGGFIGTITPP
jgi:hypothetical protein